MSGRPALAQMWWRARGPWPLALGAVYAADMFGAPAVRAALKAGVTLAAPARAAVGAPLILTGSVRALGKRTSISLEEARGRRWVRHAGTKVKRRDGGFRLKWKRRGTKTGRVWLRISARRAGKTVRSRRVRIGFSSDPALKTTAPVLTPSVKSVKAAPAARAAGKVRLSEPIEAARGDVLALGIGPETPYGMLAKITKVKHRASGSADLPTEPVALIDVVPTGSIDAKFPQGSASTAGPARIASASPFSCTNGRSIKMSASAKVTQSVDLEIDWSLFRRVNSAKLTATVGVTGSLALAADGAVSCALESREIFQKRFKPRLLTVGTVPVVLVPEASVSVSGNGSAEGHLAAGIGGSLSTTAGFEYKHHGFRPIGELSPSFTSQAPAVSAKGNLAGTFTPSVSVLFYGVAGPELAFKAGAELSAASPACYTVSAPYSLVARIKIPALHLSSPDLTIWNTTRTLARSQPHRRPVANPAPPGPRRPHPPAPCPASPVLRRPPASASPSSPRAPTTRAGFSPTRDCSLFGERTVTGSRRRPAGR